MLEETRHRDQQLQEETRRQVSIHKYEEKTILEGSL